MNLEGIKTDFTPVLLATNQLFEGYHSIDTET